jgi:hypothetical protein
MESCDLISENLLCDFEVGGQTPYIVSPISSLLCYYACSKQEQVSINE